MSNNDQLKNLLITPSQQPGIPVTLTQLDLREIELAFERILHRNGLVNGHPLTVSERQGIAIRTAIQQLHDSANLLRTIAEQLCINAMKIQARHRAQLLDETTKALGKEFRL